ncbi:MAG TPA: polyhydroxyalkanoate depolymerase, partial [Novosphingobium sp.]|nr:polyhydroxyalkanoate depolymerase [Novosphingobium sp.]
MLYKAYEIQRSLMNASSAWASMVADALTDPRNPFAGMGQSQTFANALDVFAHAAAPRGKPAFGIKVVHVDGHARAVKETTVVKRPFGDLKMFTHDGLPKDAPRLLIVAPMSGHFATLLR